MDGVREGYISNTKRADVQGLLGGHFSHHGCSLQFAPAMAQLPDSLLVSLRLSKNLKRPTYSRLFTHKDIALQNRVKRGLAVSGLLAAFPPGMRPSFGEPPNHTFHQKRSAIVLEES